MTRSITAAAITASKSSSGYSMMIMAEFDFESGYLRLHTGAGDILWDGKLFKGTGSLGRITQATEGVDLRDNVTECMITGLAPSNITSVLDENLRNRRGKLYVAFLDSDGDLVADPFIFFAGRMVNTFIRYGALMTVGIRLASPLSDWNRIRGGTWTNEFQQSLFPGDLGLEYVPEMIEKVLVWGRV